MTTKLKWKTAERTLLLNHVITDIQNGFKIKQAIKSFSEMYNLPESCVASTWQYVAEENKMYVDVAKATWKNVVKPERDAELKAKKEQEKIAKNNLKFREKIRKQKMLQAKKAKRVSVRFETNEAPKPSDKGIFFQLDSNGVVMGVRTE